MNDDSMPNKADDPEPSWLHSFDVGALFRVASLSVGLELRYQSRMHIAGIAWWRAVELSFASYATFPLDGTGNVLIGWDGMLKSGLDLNLATWSGGDGRFWIGFAGVLSGLRGLWHLPQVRQWFFGGELMAEVRASFFFARISVMGWYCFMRWPPVTDGSKPPVTNQAGETVVLPASGGWEGRLAIGVRF